MMGYFSNGAEGLDYEEMFCSRCIHRVVKSSDMPCPVWDAHEEYNYEECNNKKSILHKMIPRTGNTGNDQCIFFEDPQSPEGVT